MSNIVLIISHFFKRVENRLFIYHNRLRFKLRGIKYGHNLIVYNSIYLKGCGEVRIGNNLKFTSGGGINAISRNIRGCLYTSTPSAKIYIGNNVGISSACIWAKDSIIIGDNVKIGACCTIIDNDAHPHYYLNRRDEYAKSVGQDRYFSTIPTAPIVIEDDVWLGAQCQILKGVHIGARSIVAAGSVVTNDIPSDCIAGGNPCKIIREINT